SSSANALYRGWNLIGNPYPSAIGWSDPDWTKTNISETIAVRDNGIGNFKYWDGTGIPNDIPGGVIAAGQAFWVRATDFNPGLIAHEGIKTNEHSIYLREQQLQTLSVSLQQDSIIDITYLKVREGATLDFDNYDAPKMDNALFDISTLSADNHSVAINAMPDSLININFTTKISDAKPGQYQLKFETLNMEDRFQIRITDIYLNTEKIIAPGEIYSFEITADTLSSQPFRFRFVLEQEKIITGVPTESKIPTLYPNPSRGVILITDHFDVIRVWSSGGLEENVAVKFEDGGTRVDTSSLAHGMYLVQAISGKKVMAWKVLVE
ncbi:MAG: T9SS type A sorting domain-containing protein, partial [Flavobacterium sp.]